MYKKILVIFLLLFIILAGCRTESSTNDFPEEDPITSEKPVKLETPVPTEEEPVIELIFFKNEMVEGSEGVEVKVFKNSRYLEMQKDDVVFARIKIALGSSSEGHKQKEGDMKTPEGDYYVCYINSASQFKYFLGISYPNEADAKAAYEAEKISYAEYEQIANSISLGKTPNWYTYLGGEIGIHGGGAKSDWTWGCIAVEDDDIDYIRVYAGLGTKVTIFP